MKKQKKCKICGNNVSYPNRVFCWDMECRKKDIHRRGKEYRDKTYYVGKYSKAHLKKKIK